MCGIVGAIAERNITAILIEGLKRLEYRGYRPGALAGMGRAVARDIPPTSLREDIMRARVTIIWLPVTTR